MILGKTLIWVGLAASLFALVAYLLTTRGRTAWKVPARLAYLVMSLALFGAAGYLMHLVLSHQFQFSYVSRYSSRALPFHFLISSFWAGQEGTFLLWAMFTSVLGLVLLRTARKFEAGVMSFVLLLQGFLLLILTKLSPFALNPTTPPDGAGLNPLLQDYWMVIHPPLLFVGFAAFTIPAAYAMHAMTRRDTEEWVREALPWTAFAVLALGTAICLGGYWAYRTLGWGGYWGWDPVENSSLVPWLFGVALLHGLVVQVKRGLMKRFNLFVAVTGFLLVLYSTFLTRSGVLGDFSVHSFVDLGINAYLIAFVGGYTILGLGLYFWRLKGMRSGRFGEGFLTREYGIFLGSLALLLFAVLVLIGTSAPLLTRIAGEASNVSMAYYKTISIPFGIMISVLLALVPYLVWGAQREAPLWKALLSPLVLSGVATVILFFVGVKGPLYLLLTFSACLAVFANLEIMLSAIRRNWTWAGGYLVHIGTGLMLVGIITSTIYSQSASVVLPRGQEAEALGYRLVWNGEQPIENGQKTAYDILVTAPDGNSYRARPVMFFSPYNNGVMRRPAIMRFPRGDLYLSPQGVDRDEALDKMDKREILLAKHETANIGDATLHFEGLNSHEMTDDKIVLGGVLTLRAGDRTETLEPILTATGEGQSYQEVLSQVDGAKIVLRRVDTENSRALFYVRQPGSKHYDQPIEALYLEASTKPFIGILWAGTFVSMAGLLMSLVIRARGAHSLPEALRQKPLPLAEAAASSAGGRGARKAGAAVGT